MTTLANREILPAGLAAGRRGVTRRQAKAAILLAPAAVFLAVFFVYPLGYIVYQGVFDDGFTTAYFSDFFSQPAYVRVLWKTILNCAIVGAICLVLGYPFATLLASTGTWASRILLLCVVVPLWTSVLVRTYAWSQILGPNGVLSSFLSVFGIEIEATLVPGTAGVLIGMSQVMLPIMILTLFGGIKAINPTYEAAAQSMGAGGWTRFSLITLPLTAPVAVAGFALVFLISLGFYTVPALLGGPADTMVSQLIQQNVSVLLNLGFASAVATVLTVVTLLLYVAYAKLMPDAQIAGGRG